jgi:uncharacterized protein (DUF433 family)
MKTTECEGVVRTPGVCGGVACIERTRIPVWILNRLRQLGASDAAILEQYPDLQPRDLVCAWKYVALHPSEIDEAARQNGI